MRDLEEKSFVLLVIVVTVAFVVDPVAVQRGDPVGDRARDRVQAALPPYPARDRREAECRRARLLGGSPFIVVLPVIGITAALVRQAVATYKQLELSKLDPGLFLSRIPEMLPGWAADS